MASFLSSLASMANYLDRPLWSDSISTSYGGGWWSGTSPSLDSFSSGGLPDRSLSSMLGFGGLSSRNFLRFGIASQIAGNVRASIPQGQFGMPDYVTSFLNGGMSTYGSGMPGGFNPPPVAVPRFGQMQQPQPQSAPYSPGATSVNIGTADNDEKPEAKPSISNDAVTSAETALFDAGYGTGEARGIVEKAKTAADGNEGKFKSIMEKVPRKSLTKEELGKIKPDEQQKAKDEYQKKWQRELGKWYARYIQGMGEGEAEKFVKRVAFGPGDGEIDVVRDEKSPGENEGYRITNDPGFGEFKAGGFIYKKKGSTDNEWYSDKNCAKEIAGATSEDNNKVTVPASLEDYVDVKYMNKIDDNGYEIYTVSDKSAKSPPNFYRDSSGKWYTKNDKDNYTPLASQPDYSGDEGRIYFSRAPRSFRSELDDTRKYIDALDKGLESYNVAKETEKKIRKDRFERFRQEVAKPFGAKKDKFKVEYNADRNCVDITVKPADATEVRKALVKLPPEGDITKLMYFTIVFNILPRDTLIQFNGAMINVGGDPFAMISGKLEELEKAEKAKSVAPPVKKKSVAKPHNAQKGQAGGTASKPPAVKPPSAAASRSVHPPPPAPPPAAPAPPPGRAEALPTPRETENSAPTPAPIKAPAVAAEAKPTVQPAPAAQRAAPPVAAGGREQARAAARRMGRERADDIYRAVPRFGIPEPSQPKAEPKAPPSPQAVALSPPATKGNVRKPAPAEPRNPAQPVSASSQGRRSNPFRLRVSDDSAGKVAAASTDPLRAAIPLRNVETGSMAKYRIQLEIDGGARPKDISVFVDKVGAATKGVIDRKTAEISKLLPQKRGGTFGIKKIMMIVGKKDGAITFALPSDKIKPDGTVESKGLDRKQQGKFLLNINEATARKIVSTLNAAKGKITLSDREKKAYFVLKSGRNGGITITRRFNYHKLFRPLIIKFT